MDSAANVVGDADDASGADIALYAVVPPQSDYAGQYSGIRCLSRIILQSVHAYA